MPQGRAMPANPACDAAPHSIGLGGFGSPPGRFWLTLAAELQALAPALAVLEGAGGLEVRAARGPRRCQRPANRQPGLTVNQVQRAVARRGARREPPRGYNGPSKDP